MNKKTIDLTPDWHGVYRWLMYMKKTDEDHYHHLIKKGDGEFEKILNLAEKNGWDRGDNGV
tara:strand:- start:185 stop:367 length:183 start_codon:yes stop_codon:yes gene_type:complete